MFAYQNYRILVWTTTTLLNFFVKTADCQCSPIYVRWSRVRLNIIPKISGPYSMDICKNICAEKTIPGQEHVVPCIGFNHMKGPNTLAHECQVFGREQVTGLDGLAEADDKFSFYWKYCVKTRQLCNSDFHFSYYADRYTDAASSRKVLENNQSIETCLAHCLDETQFDCRSVSYNRTAKTCSLSASNQRTQPGDIRINKDPNFRIDYYENNCYNKSFTVRHECKVNGILVFVEAKQPYSGALYGLYDYFTCRTEPKEQTFFTHFFPYPEKSRNCSDSIRTKDNEYLLEVVLSTDGVEPLYFITPDDLTYQATCPVAGKTVASVDTANTFDFFKQPNDLPGFSSSFSTHAHTAASTQPSTTSRWQSTPKTASSAEKKSISLLPVLDHAPLVNQKTSAAQSSKISVRFRLPKIKLTGNPPELVDYNFSRNSEFLLDLSRRSYSSKKDDKAIVYTSTASSTSVFEPSFSAEKLHSFSSTAKPNRITAVPDGADKMLNDSEFAITSTSVTNTSNTVIYTGAQVTASNAKTDNTYTASKDFTVERAHTAYSLEPEALSTEEEKRLTTITVVDRSTGSSIPEPFTAATSLRIRTQVSSSHNSPAVNLWQRVTPVTVTTAPKSTTTAAPTVTVVQNSAADELTTSDATIYSTTTPKQPIMFDIFHGGRPVDAVVVGSRITLSITPYYAIPPSYMTIRGCQVEPVGSAYSWEREPLAIIKDGCQSDNVGLVCPPERTDFGMRIVAEAFRYQSTAQVQYTCLVRICQYVPCPQEFCPQVEGCVLTHTVPRSYTSYQKFLQQQTNQRQKRQLYFPANGGLPLLPTLTLANANRPIANSAVAPPSAAFQHYLNVLAGDHVVSKSLVIVNSENALQFYIRTGSVPTDNFAFVGHG